MRKPAVGSQKRALDAVPPVCVLMSATSKEALVIPLLPAMAALIKTDIERWGRYVKLANIPAQ